LIGENDNGEGIGTQVVGFDVCQSDKQVDPYRRSLSTLFDILQIEEGRRRRRKRKKEERRRRRRTFVNIDTV